MTENVQLSHECFSFFDFDPIFLGEALLLVVGVNVAVLTLAFGVVHPLWVLAVPRVSVAAIAVIAVVAHALGEVLQVHVRAVRNRAWSTTRFRRVPHD